jgi:hypothetical protein
MPILELSSSKAFFRSLFSPCGTLSANSTRNPEFFRILLVEGSRKANIPEAFPPNRISCRCAATEAADRVRQSASGPTEPKPQASKREKNPFP